MIHKIQDLGSIGMIMHGCQEKMISLLNALMVCRIIVSIMPYHVVTFTLISILVADYIHSGIPEFRPFGQKGKFSAFGFRFRPPKLKAEYGRNSRKALDFLLFVHENIANVNYQW